MKKLIIVLSFFLSFIFVNCSQYAEDAANSDGFSAEDINGKWKEGTTGLVINISGVTDSSLGKGQLITSGTAYPSSAVGGYPMTEVEYHTGGYWDAYNNTYYTTNGGKWIQANIIGLAMNSSKSEFRIGTVVYKRQ